MNPRWPRRGLYAITPDEPDTARLLARVQTVLRAGAAWLQYRNKTAPATICAQNRRRRCSRCAARWRAADHQRRLAPGRGDRRGRACTWARTTANSPRPARALAAGAILGASCYDDLRLARRSRGRRRQTTSLSARSSLRPTKPHARRATPDLLRDAAPLRPAAGGDRRHHAGQCAAAGRGRRRPDRRDQRRVRRARPRRRRARLPLLFRRPPRHEQRPLARPVHPRQGADSRRRQFAGARVQVGRRRAVLRAARGRRLPVRRRRQPLRRLRRLLGADDRRPRASAGARRGDDARCATA